MPRKSPPPPPGSLSPLESSSPKGSSPSKGSSSPLESSSSKESSSSGESSSPLESPVASQNIDVQLTSGDVAFVTPSIGTGPLFPPPNPRDDGRTPLDDHTQSFATESRTSKGRMSGLSVRERVRLMEKKLGLKEDEESFDVDNDPTYDSDESQSEGGRGILAEDKESPLSFVAKRSGKDLEDSSGTKPREGLVKKMLEIFGAAKLPAPPEVDSVPPAVAAFTAAESPVLDQVLPAEEPPVSPESPPLAPFPPAAGSPVLDPDSSASSLPAPGFPAEASPESPLPAAASPAAESPEPPAAGFLTLAPFPPAAGFLTLAPFPPAAASPRPAPLPPTLPAFPPPAAVPPASPPLAPVSPASPRPASPEPLPPPHPAPPPLAAVSPAPSPPGSPGPLSSDETDKQKENAVKKLQQFFRRRLKPKTSNPIEPENDNLLPSVNNSLPSTNNLYAEIEEISIDDKEFLKKYLRNLQINSDQKSGVVFKKVKFVSSLIDSQGQINADFSDKFGKGKVTNLNYFDISSRFASQRIFYPQDVLAKDNSLDEYQKQLALRLTIHDKLFEQLKALYTANSGDLSELTPLKINDKIDSKTIDIDFKICQLLIKINEKFPPQLNDQKERDNFDILIHDRKEYLKYLRSKNGNKYIDSDIGAISDSDITDFKTISPKKIDYSEIFYANFATQSLQSEFFQGFDQLQEDSLKFYYQAKIIMQNEALRAGIDAEFLKYGLKKIADVNFKTLDRDISKEKSRVIFSRYKDQNEANVRVDIRGRYDKNLDSINICIDSSKNIYRQFLLKSGLLGKPEIESSCYVMEIDGKMHEIKIKKTLSDYEYYYGDNKKLLGQNLEFFKTAISHEKILLSINQKKYNFKAIEGVDVEDNRKIDFNFFDDKNNVSSKTQSFELKNPMNRDGNFKIDSSPTKPTKIKIYSEYTSQKDDISPRENHKIGIIESNNSKLNLHLIRLDGQKYKLYKEEKGVFHEYNYNPTEDTIKLQSGDISINANPRNYVTDNSVINRFTIDETPRPYSKPYIPTSPVKILPIEKNIFKLRVESQMGVKEVFLEFSLDNIAIKQTDLKSFKIAPHPSSSPSDPNAKSVTQSASL